MAVEAERTFTARGTTTVGDDIVTATGEIATSELGIIVFATSGTSTEIVSSETTAGDAKSNATVSSSLVES